MRTFVDGQGALDGSSVLTLYKRIIPPQRFLSKRPIDGFQRQNEQPTQYNFKRQRRGAAK